MSSSTIRVSGIKDESLYPLVYSLGFNKAKQCGKGPKSLISIIGLNYIESLILRQLYYTRNILFLQPYLNNLNTSENKAKFTTVLNYISKIEQGTANHTEFILHVKESQDLLEEIFEFSLYIFNIPAACTEREILEILPYVSVDLNVQFIFYNETQVIIEVKNNKYSEPVVLNFLYLSDSETFYLLYHASYQVISQESRNITQESFYDKKNLYDEADLVLLQFIVYNIKKANPRLDENQKSQLREIIKRLKEADLYGEKAEYELAEIINPN